MTRNTKQVLFAVGILLAWVAGCYQWAQLSAEKLGIVFQFIALHIITRNLFLYSGLVLLILRLFKVIHANIFIYILAGIFNAGLGIVSILLYLYWHQDTAIVHLGLYNLLLAVILLTDRFLLQHGDKDPTIGTTRK